MRSFVQIRSLGFQRCVPQGRANGERWPGPWAYTAYLRGTAPACSIPSKEPDGSEVLIGPYITRGLAAGCRRSLVRRSFLVRCECLKKAYLWSNRRLHWCWSMWLLGRWFWPVDSDNNWGVPDLLVPDIIQFVLDNGVATELVLVLGTKKGGWTVTGVWLDGMRGSGV